MTQAAAPQISQSPARDSVWRFLMSAAALSAFAACDQIPDPDLRGLGEGFSTTEAAQNAPTRPTPDSRGVISYADYQVVVARQGDTVGSIAARLGLAAPALASYNGLQADTPLRANEIIALPTRVSEPVTTSSFSPAAAGAAIDRAGSVTTTALAPSAPAATNTPAAPPPRTGEEPIRHQVVRGESVYSIARLYNVSVSDIAEWNGLGADLTVREGSFLLIPQGGSAPAQATTSVTTPGEGSPTPVPPSAAEPLPDENPPPVDVEPEPPEDVAPDLGATQTEAPSSAQFVMPVQGSIIREYVKGRNDGIDIGAPAGTDVKAAAAGTVAAVTTNTEGIRIVVIKHADNLLTVYTHLDNLSVQQGSSVSRGQVIGKVRSGDPSFVHFEVRLGMDSRDPADYLP
ncbi:MAG: peptidoglycan DD-metalloendopeptidase family protein [Rhodobacterales bacterium]|nr:peptidoglycan DD-metalloendopeptidase family protein [Rhodobacterales bacterium]